MNDINTERSLRFRKKHFIRIHTLLKLESLVYSLIILSLVISLISLGILTKEDLCITVENFYIGVRSRSQASNYTIRFAGLIPYDFVKDLDLKRITKIKFYFNPNIKEFEKDNFKSFATVRDVNYSSLPSLTKDNKYYFNQYLSDTKVVRMLEAGLLTMNVSNVDDNGNNLVDILNNYITDNKYSTSVKKAKIIFGKRSLLGIWIKKMFDKSSVFKKAGYLLE